MELYDATGTSLPVAADGAGVSLAATDGAGEVALPAGSADWTGDDAGSKAGGVSR